MSLNRQRLLRLLSPVVQKPRNRDHLSWEDPRCHLKTVSGLSPLASSLSPEAARSPPLPPRFPITHNWSQPTWPLDLLASLAVHLQPHNSGSTPLQALSGSHLAMFPAMTRKDPSSLPYSGPSSTWPGPALEGCSPSSVPCTAFQSSVHSLAPGLYFCHFLGQESSASYCSTKQCCGLTWARLCWVVGKRGTERIQSLPSGSSGSEFFNLPQILCKN